jgi:glycosyltransferase involved in cell wall biosynthesis
MIQAAQPHRIIAVIPAFNEERTIGSVVIRTRRYANTVIVIDDGSRDATAEIAAAAGAILVRHTANSGKGVALNTGFEKAKEFDPDVVVTLDADWQHAPEELDDVVRPILMNQADIVIGSRYLKEDNEVPLTRIIGHSAFNALTNRLSGTTLTDSQSGFRAFSRRALQSLSFRSNGFSVESEMQFLLKEHSLRAMEVPITIRYDDKPKRPVLAHGFMVLNGILNLLSYHRPMLFFGLSGFVLIAIGLIVGLSEVVDYASTRRFDPGIAIVAGLMIEAGIVLVFAGVVLHALRALRLEMRSTFKDA